MSLAIIIGNYSIDVYNLCWVLDLESSATVFIRLLA